jgi:hypothetical protein
MSGTEDDPTLDTGAEDPAPSHGGADEEGSRARVLRFAKRLLDRRELAEDTKELVSAVISSSDKAKNEVLRLVAREVRSYLKELQLREELAKLVKDYSIEVSIRFKPIATSDKPSVAPEDQEEPK